MPFWKIKAAVANAGVRFENAARQTDDGLQVTFGQKHFAQFGRRIGRTEKHAIRHDDTGTSAGREMVNEPFEEKQFGGAGVQLVIEVGENAFILHFAGERRIGENDIKPLAGIDAAKAGRERIEMVNLGAFQLVQVKVKDGDFHHVGVVVEAGERLFFKEFPLRGFEHRAVHIAAFEVGGFGVLAQNVGERGNQKARRAARGIANALAGLRIHQFNDEVNDVARGAELAVRAGRGKFGKEIFIHIALEIVAVVRGQVHFLNALNDGAERGAVVNFERGAAEQKFAGVGQAGQFVQTFDGVADGIEKLVTGKRDEIAPCEARPFAGKNAGVFFIERGERFVLFGEQTEKKQIGNLLNGIHRVVHAARVKDVHELVNFLTQAR